MTLGELENDCLERLKLDYGQSDGAARLRVRRYLNEWHRRILTTPGLEQLRDDVWSFNSVQAQARYALNQNIGRIRRIYEPNTNRIRLVERSLDWYRNLPTTISGVPECYIPFGRNKTQFMIGGNLASGNLAFGPTASGLWVSSDNTGDANQLYTECFRTGGYLQRDRTTLTGTTRVEINSNTDFLECTKAYLDMPGLGNVSMWDAASGGDELLRIAAGNLTADYLSLILWPAPSGVWTFYVDYSRKVTQLLQPTDRPQLDEDFDDLLMMGARYSEAEYKKDLATLQTLRQDMVKRASDLFDYCNSNPDLVIIPGQQPRGTRFSNLGSWFPSGSW